MTVIAVGIGEEKLEAGGRYDTVLKMGGMDDDTLLEYMSMRSGGEDLHSSFRAAWILALLAAGTCQGEKFFHHVTCNFSAKGKIPYTYSSFEEVVRVLPDEPQRIVSFKQVCRALSFEEKHTILE